MKVVAIVQARVRSTRLPAKIFLDLGGATALERCLRRVQRVAGIDEVVVATSRGRDDDLVVALTRRLGVTALRGSEDDVLGRFADVAKETSADVVVRFTSDCPLLDPAVSSLVLTRFVEQLSSQEPPAYASNTLERRLPRGLDTEVFTSDALMRAARDGTGEER